MSCIDLYINPYISLDVTSRCCWLLSKLCVQLKCQAWPWSWPKNLLHLPISAQKKVGPNSTWKHTPTCCLLVKRDENVTQALSKPEFTRTLSTTDCSTLTARSVNWNYVYLLDEGGKKGGSRGSVPWWDAALSTHKHYLRAMFYAHLSEATNKTKTHVHLGWLLCILLHGK